MVHISRLENFGGQEERAMLISEALGIFKRRAPEYRLFKASLAQAI